MATKRKTPAVNPAVKWQQLAAAVIELRGHVERLERRVRQLELPAGFAFDYSLGGECQSAKSDES